MMERGLFDSRAKAREAIEAGLVRADGVLVLKPSEMVEEHVSIRASLAHPWVGRGALKLVHALDLWPIAVEGKVAIDIGASTGGFTEVLLSRGAAKVYAVDVGHGQLHESLELDARVVALEGQDARTLSRALIPDEVGAVTADVSFISLAKALPAALALTERDAWLVALVQPQFEVGPEAVGKGGIVREREARDAAVASVSHWLEQEMGWSLVGVVPSPIAGGSGNREYLLGARRRD
jgi:23S rRNA (cytidine1920-2'-O)/16S rRNA (cytidine1409-2'-O)-methyltransferase